MAGWLRERMILIAERDEAQSEAMALHAEKEVEALKAEIERLRGILRVRDDGSILDPYVDWESRLARADRALLQAAADARAWRSAYDVAVTQAIQVGVEREAAKKEAAGLREALEWVVGRLHLRRTAGREHQVDLVGIEDYIRRVLAGGES